MADCELLEGCLFFNEQMAGMPVSTMLLKQMYCHGHNAKCARYMLFREFGRENVPADLFPNFTETARRMISKNKGKTRA